MTEKITTWPMRAAIALMFVGVATLVAASILRNGTVLYAALGVIVAGAAIGLVVAPRGP